MQNDIDPRPIIVDIETAALANAGDYCDPVEPDSRLKDPQKIKDNILDKTIARSEKYGLDRNTGRIVAIGWWTEASGTMSVTAPDAEAERSVLESFWTLAKHRTIITFNGRSFDLPFMLQRSLLLNVQGPMEMDTRPYHSLTDNIDVFLALTYGDKSGICMRQTLGAFCRRFGIPHDDSVSGKDVQRLVDAGEWDAVLKHVTDDIDSTVALARRVRLL